MTFTKILLLATLVVEAVVQCHTDTNQVLRYSGDIKLAAFFPIHKAGDVHNVACGEIQKEDGIQPLEAMLFTLDEINENATLLPDIRLGAIAVDSCDNPIHAADKALPLLKGFMRRRVVLSNCTVHNRTWPNTDDNIVGVLGPQTSAVSLEIANLGRLFHIPQVSYLSTSVTLCQRDKFPHFFRTVPSDVHQARAIVELLNTFDWNYASFVHSDSEYGVTGYQLVKQAVERNKDICLADPITIYNRHFKMTDYERVVNTLAGLASNKSDELTQKQHKRSPRVVIVFADREPAGKLLQAAKNLGVKDKFVWVGSDAWASREIVVENREEFVEGAIAIQPLRRELPGYNSYFHNLILSPNQRNPWFEEYMEEYHNCSKQNKRKRCPRSNKTSSSELVKYSQQLYIHFVRDAVYAFAHALHNLHVDSCGPRGFVENRLCHEFRHRVFLELDTYLSNVSFPDVEGNMFRFYSDNDTHSQGTHMHDGPPRYSIINFRRDPTSGMYDWHNVGTYLNGQITQVDSEFRKRFSSANNNSFFSSGCDRQPCLADEIKVWETDDRCCWHCAPCGITRYRVTEYECKDCNEGERSMLQNNTAQCVLIDETYMSYSSPWAISAMSVAVIGILMTFAAIHVFWQFWGTPIVKACGRDLSMILLLGNFFSFVTTFIVVSKPFPIMCGLVRFCVGFCYTICYAAVVTKTNRVWRIFNARTNGSIHPKFTSPCSSAMIVLGLVGVEVVINVIWLVVEPPDTTHIVNIPGKRILVCKGVDEQIMTGLIYPFFLICCATVYAFLTRKLPVGFNETKFIFFANIITTIHWFAYVPLYLASTEHEIRAVILAFSLSLSGLVQLGCLIFPRLYTVLFKPKDNTATVVMRPHRSRATFTVPETPPNSVAVGLADGPLLGSYQEMTINMPESSMYSLAATNALQLKLDHQGQETFNNGQAKNNNALTATSRRHPTWSHDLNLHERPRSRSLSVSRSTQTREEQQEALTEIKKLKLTVETADESTSDSRSVALSSAAVATALVAEATKQDFPEEKKGEEKVPCSVDFVEDDLNRLPVPKVDI